MPTPTPADEERKAAREAYEDSLVATVRLRRIEVLEELSTIQERQKEEVQALLQEGRGLGLSMAELTRAAGWKSRQTTYDYLGEPPP